MNGAANLVVDDVQVRFGGLVAVRSASLHAPGRSITGLIGPNGAGKTTTFNACTGLVTPVHGTVRLGDHDLSSLSSARRAQLGLGRTFQRMELWDAMTVRENVALGREARQVGRALHRYFRTSGSERREALDTADRAIELCGLSEHANVRVGELSTGVRRLTELARAVAGQYAFLLLDEPSSGLDEGETEAFGHVLGTLVEEEGVGILLVEHDMSLVRQVCQYLYVLDFGELIYEGETATALASAEVRAAYLGTTAEVA